MSERSHAPPSSLPHPGAGERWALFLDFDGTLAEIAAHPAEVAVSPRLPCILRRLEIRLDGALALVSGRPIETLDAYLRVPGLAAAGLHGLERRLAGQAVARTAAAERVDERQRSAILELAAADPRLLVEDKGLTIALHYRGAPERQAECVQLVAAQAALAPGYHFVEGKMVVELKPDAANKGSAIESFMSEPVFAGRRPVFAGDDTTDEDGFASVQGLGGYGVKVGPGETLARHRVPDVASVIQWLDELACRATS